MLNLELLNSLYDSLPAEQQKALCAQLFKKSKQTMAYFSRTKDISLSKLEVIADFFHLPLDHFRKNSAFKTNVVTGNGNLVGNININNNLIMENEMLKGKIADLMKTISAKDETIAAKNETLTARIEEIISLKQRLQEARKNKQE